MHVQPLSDYVLVKPVEVKETASGIIMPDTAQKRPQEGVVVAAGPGRHTLSGDFIPMEKSIVRGKTVYYGSYAGVEHEFNGQTCLVLKQGDILLVEVEEADGRETPTVTSADHVAAE